MTAETEFCLLGPMALLRGGIPGPVPPGKQRVLLAALLLRAGRSVNLDELAGVLWESGAPQSARGSLHTYVARLRGFLNQAGDPAIVTEPGGYRIDVSPAHLDVSRFEAALAAGRSAVRAGDWAGAAGVLRQGLALWRGQPLTGVPSDVLAAREVPRLAELRLQALEARIDADLRLGRHADVVPELRALTGAEPLRERLHGLLMMALYQDGQQAAALAAYQAVRAVLVDELGTEPGPELQRLHQQVLVGDPAIAGNLGQGDAGPGDNAGSRSSSSRGTGSSGTGSEDTGAKEPGAGDTRSGDSTGASGAAQPGIEVRYSLPPDTAAFTGRDDELRQITAAQPGGLVVIRVIDGMPGVGKTALAIHAAHTLRPAYPGGQLFVDLRGHTPGQRPLTPEDALAGLLSAAGVDTPSLPPDLDGRSARWRDRTAGQRTLLVLDNAASSAQVAPLLPGGDGSLVLVTSRRHLADLPATVGSVQLVTLPPERAAEMFTRLAPRAAHPPGPAPPPAGPAPGPADPASRAAIAGLVALAGHLPLAISLLARVYNRHPAWTLADLAAETRASLLTLTAETDSVAAAFAVSYDHMGEGQQRFFRRLGLHPGTAVDSFAAAALAAVPEATAAAYLDALHAEGLLTETGYRRYGMHDLIRRYAAERVAADPAAGNEQAMARLLDYYQHTAARAERIMSREGRGPSDPGSPRDSSGPRDSSDPREPAGRAVAVPPAAAPALPGTDAALAWLRAERTTLLACLDLAAQDGDDERVIGLTAALATLLRQDGPAAEAVRRHTAAVAAAGRRGDRAAEAAARRECGVIRRVSGDYEGAARDLGAALGLFRALGDRRGEARARNDLGSAYWRAGDYAAAARELDIALAVFGDLDDRPGQASARYDLGLVRLMTGDYSGASRQLNESLALARNLGDRAGQARALTDVGGLRYMAGDYPAAIAAMSQALGLYRQTGDRLGQAGVLSQLAPVRREAGDDLGAAGDLQDALRIFRDVGSRLGQAAVLSQLGVTWRVTGRYDAAGRVLREALAIYRELGDRPGQANALTYLGPVLRLAGDHAAAAAALDEAVASFAAAGDRGGHAEALNEVGALRQDTGDLTGARTAYGQALRLARQISSPLDEARALAGLGRGALAAGDRAAAVRRLRQAHEILERLGAREVTGVAGELQALTAASARRPRPVG